MKLSGLGVKSNSTLEYILQEIDHQINGGSDGVWNYNYYCLDDNAQILNRRQFVEEVSRQICLNKNDIAGLQQDVQPIPIIAQNVHNLQYPQYTSSSFIGIIPSDSSTTITDKLANAIDVLNSKVDVSAVNWSATFPVMTPPTSISGGFTEVIRQIGLLNTAVTNITGVGTFDTTNYCIPTKTPNTPLTTVVNELLAEDCKNAKFDFPSVTWGCVTAPTGNDFQDAFQQVVSVLGGLVEEKPVFDSGQFDVVPLPSCQGYEVKLKPNIFDSDGKVYVKNSSLNKHFLEDVIKAGTNVSLTVTDDDITINATSTNDAKVAVDSSSPAGYLEDVIEGSDYQGVIQINPTKGAGGTLVLTPSINEELLADMILNTITANPTLMNKLCNLICGCQNNCS